MVVVNDKLSCQLSSAQSLRSPLNGNFTILHSKNMLATTFFFINWCRMVDHRYLTYATAAIHHHLSPSSSSTWVIEILSIRPLVLSIVICDFVTLFSDNSAMKAEKRHLRTVAFGHESCKEGFHSYSYFFQCCLLLSTSRRSSRRAGGCRCCTS